jgi:hypothetical protein
MSSPLPFVSVYGRLPAFRPPGPGGANSGPPQPPRPWQTAAQQQQPKPPAPVLRINSSVLQKPKKRKGDAKDGGRPVVSIKPPVRTFEDVAIARNPCGRAALVHSAEGLMEGRGSLQCRNPEQG